MEALRRQSPASVLYTHNVEIHPGLKMSKDDFVMTVEGNYSRACLRQSQEGVAIANSIRRMKEGAKVILLNGKREFIQPGVVRPAFGALVYSN